MTIDTDLTHDLDPTTDEPVTIGEPVTVPEHLVEVRRRPVVAAALGAGAWKCCGSADRYLGIRLCSLRNDHGRAGVQR